MNNEKEIQLLKEQTQDLADRSMACPADSEDYMKYQKMISQNVNLIIADAKNKMDHEEELKRIELEKDRLKKEFNWKDPKFLIPLGMSFLTTVVSIYSYGAILREHRNATMLFEKDGNMFTTLAGRSNSNMFSNIFGKVLGNKGQF